jgi:hypothetical protein
MSNLAFLSLDTRGAPLASFLLLATDLVCLVCLMHHWNSRALADARAALSLFQFGGCPLSVWGGAPAAPEGVREACRRGVCV